MAAVSSTTSYVGWAMFYACLVSVYPSKLFSTPDLKWRKPKGGQRLTVAKSLKSVGASRLPGWGLRDPPNAWLETLQDMAANRSPWRMCCQSLDRLIECLEV